MDTYTRRIFQKRQFLDLRRPGVSKFANAMDQENFAPQLIEFVLTRNRINKPKLAKLLGVEANQVYRWARGEHAPGAHYVQKLFQLAGGDWRRAIEVAADNPELQEVRSQPLPVVGRIQAGDANTAVEDVRYLDLENDVWATSPAWSYGEGDVRYLTVTGDSMAPEYPDGSRIAIRLRRSGVKIPKLLPCIIVDSKNRYTFKLYGERRDTGSDVEFILGIPVNRAHEPLLWRKGEAEVWAVVHGTIHVPHSPATVYTISRGSSGLIMRDSAGAGIAAEDPPEILP
jgi:transcriptional regulator with XRE-family HTH domain